MNPSVSDSWIELQISMTSDSENTVYLFVYILNGYKARIDFKPETGSTYLEHIRTPLVGSR